MANYSDALWHPDKSRQIRKRIVVEGTLVLETPAHFGNGEQDGTELILLQDAIDNRPLLPGASLAGALRHHLIQRQYGYRNGDHKNKKRGADYANFLFGEALDDEREDTRHSCVIIDDARGEKPETAKNDEQMMRRDGVKIDPTTRTADDGALFTVQTWSAGTTFPLRFELIISDDDDDKALVSYFATALHALGTGEIPMGARKNRGYGRCRVQDWRVITYDMTQISDVLAWVNTNKPAQAVTNTLQQALRIDLMKEDKRQFMRFDLDLQLCDSLLIRAGSDVSQMAHLAHHDDTLVVSGTSIAGALRARALTIANTVNPDHATALVDDLFGVHGGDNDDTDKLTASRVLVEEHAIRRNGDILQRDDNDFVQNRVKIDRFTGGAFETALFDQEPVFAVDDTRIKVVFEFRYPDENAMTLAQLGLLLLVLKDLWTEDLPLGGESSIGRGRLRGVGGQICYTDITLADNDNFDPIGLHLDGTSASPAQIETLNQYVSALHQYVRKQNGQK